MLAWINTNLNKPLLQQKAEPIINTNNNNLLPGSLSGKILDLQFLCDGQHVTKQLIAVLTALYTEAVQYYQEMGSRKYKIYQKRMEYFLKKPTIDDILRGKSGQLVNKKDSAEKTLSQAKTKSKSAVHKILDETQKYQKKSKEIVHNDIKKQNQQLQQRIQRRKTMSNRSSRTAERDEEQNQQGKQRCNMMNKNMLLEGIFERHQVKKKRVFI